jgi:hypothetical protein
MNFPLWLDYALVGGLFGVAAAFGKESWSIAAISIPVGVLTGAVIGFFATRRGRTG